MGTLFEKDFLASDWIVLDSNITIDLMHDFINFCAKNSLNILYEPTSSEKSIKLLQCNGLSKVKVITPNIRELLCMSNYIEKNIEDKQYKDEELSFELAEIHALRLIKAGAENIIVKMGSKGVLLVTKTTKNDVCIEKFPALPANVKNVIGAGDNLVAGIIYGLSKRKTLKESIKYGLMVAKKNLC